MVGCALVDGGAMTGTNWNLNSSMRNEFRVLATEGETSPAE
jgi:hypothetical protein